MSINVLAADFIRVDKLRFMRGDKPITSAGQISGMAVISVQPKKEEKGLQRNWII
jgi:hypothetical protein